MWGMSRTQIVNLVDGVTKGYSQTLEIHGVGFRAAMKGKDSLQLQVGFSHDVLHKIPAGVEVKVAGAKQEIDRRSPASTSRRSARSPPRSAPRARPSPTRARASAIRANTSTARKARRSEAPPCAAS